VPDSGQKNTSFGRLLRELTRKTVDPTASARSRAALKRDLPWRFGRRLLVLAKCDRQLLLGRILVALRSQPGCGLVAGWLRAGRGLIADWLRHFGDDGASVVAAQGLVDRIFV
jgi:hypothetical protein